MRFSTLPVFTLLASWAYAIRAATVPGADTPLFYFVSTTQESTANLLPLRIDGGTGGFSTLNGVGSIGELYFYQGQLVAKDPAGSTTFYKAYINSIPESDCTTFGQLGFIQGSTTNKCAAFQGFEIQSDTENSQLGAQLVFNYVGGFYACGPTNDVWYKVSSDQGPSDCNPISLFTVPVAPADS